MNKLTSAMMDMMSMDELSKDSSFVHAIHPLCKLIITIVYIVVVLSYEVDNLTGLIPMILIPVILFALSGIELRVCFYKLRLILPLIIFIGIWNPVINRTPAMSIGAIVITEGMISFFTLLLKSVLALMMSFVLVATTGIDRICLALRKLHVPTVVVSLILITYRYIMLLLGEADTLWTAYSLRAPGQKGVHVSAWGSFLGQLLLRSMDRSAELYGSMKLRGFTGEYDYAGTDTINVTDISFTLISMAAIILIRLINISTLIGGAFV